MPSLRTIFGKGAKEKVAKEEGEQEEWPDKSFRPNVKGPAFATR